MLPIPGIIIFTEEVCEAMVGVVVIFQLRSRAQKSWRGYNERPLPSMRFSRIGGGAGSIFSKPYDSVYTGCYGKKWSYKSMD